MSQRLWAAAAVLHDTANAGARASNIKYVPWEAIATALGLPVDTSYDARVVGR